MPQELTQAGDFRGEICSYKLQEYQSSAVAIGVLANVHDVWNPETREWEDWRQHGFQAPGYIFVIKKDGALNESQVSALVLHAGWDGNMESITAKTWKPTPCQFSVEENTYKESTSYRVAWINGYDSEPGAGGVDPTRARELQNKFGSQLRAVAGNAVRNALPSTPVTPVTTPETTQPPEDAKDDIPF